MSFQNPYLLLLLLIPFIFFALLVLTNKEGALRVFSKEVLERLRVADSGLSSRARNALLFGAIFMMIIAIGHPYIQKGQKEVTLSGIEAVVALDISRSMRSKDLYPNRLEFAKAKIKQMLQEMPEDEATLIAFSNSVYLVSPMTSDKETLKQVVDGITTDYLSGRANFSELAEVLKQKLHNKEQKIVIVVSSGAEASKLVQFEDTIKSEHIKLYAILIGTKKGAPLLNKEGKVVLKGDRVVMSQLESRLGAIAKASGGDFIIANYGTEDIKTVLGKLQSSVVQRDKGKVLKVKERVELFYYPLLIALVLLFMAQFSQPVPKRGDDAS